MKPAAAPIQPRNPGPNWGYLFLTRADAVLRGPDGREEKTSADWVAG